MTAPEPQAAHTEAGEGLSESARVAAAVAALHVADGEFCAHCGRLWPCRTTRLIRGEEL
jgi:hypothetical protein